MFYPEWVPTTNLDGRKPLSSLVLEFHFDPQRAPPSDERNIGDDFIAFYSAASNKDPIGCNYFKTLIILSLTAANV